MFLLKRLWLVHPSRLKLFCLCETQLSGKAAFFLFSCILFFSSCKQEIGSNNSLIDNPNGSLIDLSYDLEQVSFTKFGNGTPEVNKNLSMVDRVSATPKVQKQNFFISIFEDGTSEMTIKRLEPDHKDLILNDSNPKDPHGIIHIIKKKRDGSYHVFNAKGDDLLADRNMTLPSQDFSPIIKKVLENRKNVNPSDLPQFLFDNAPKFNASFKDLELQGASVSHLEGSIFQVDVAVINTGDNSAIKTNFRNEKDFISETIVDTSAKVVLGGSLLNKDKSPVSQFFVKYTQPDTKNEKPKVEIVHQEITSPKFVGNKKATLIHDSYYSNQSFKIH